jgi:hypothetical protein
MSLIQMARKNKLAGMWMNDCWSLEKLHWQCQPPEQWEITEQCYWLCLK